MNITIKTILGKKLYKINKNDILLIERIDQEDVFITTKNGFHYITKNQFKIIYKVLKKDCFLIKNSLIVFIDRIESIKKIKQEVFIYYYNSNKISVVDIKYFNEINKIITINKIVNF